MRNLLEKILFLLDKILAVIITFLTPIHFVLMAVGAFILLDTIIGYWKAIKINEKRTSKKLAKVIPKMLIYQLVVITFFTLDYAIIHDVLYNIFNVPYLLTKLIALILIWIELYSIDESWEQATGKSLFTRFKEMIFKVKESKNIMKKLEDN